MQHRKRTARENAAEKIVQRDHLPEEPKLPRDDQHLNRGRFAGETPLTGEDRPVDKAGNKQEGFDEDAPEEHAAAGKPAMKRQGPATTPKSGTRARNARK